MERGTLWGNKKKLGGFSFTYQHKMGIILKEENDNKNK
jgi:hypothetical protein